MKTIFRAVGPDFARGLLVEPFESVHVYALLCRLLDIAPEPHDGSLLAVTPMLRQCGAPGPAPAPAPGVGAGPPRRDSRGNSDTWRPPPATTPATERRLPVPGPVRVPGPAGPIAVRCSLQLPGLGPRPRSPGRCHLKGV